MTTAGYDVAIIGGGIAGVTAARHLAKHCSVVLLEQESELAYHTTSRSAAMYLENEGGPVNHRLSTASRSFFEDPPLAIDAPLLAPAGSLDVGPVEMTEEFERQAEEAARVTTSIRLVHGPEIAELCPALRPDRAVIGVWEPHAASIDVMALHQLFLRDAKANGLAVMRSSRVIALNRAGGRWKVGTAGGSIEATSVVNAAGAWGDVVGNLAGAAPIGLVPRRRTAFTSPVDADTSGWPIVQTPLPGAQCYFRPEAGGQLLCSLADETPSAPCDARPEEVDIALAIERLNELTTLGIRSVRTSWAGLRTFAPDRNPVIGWDDEIEGFCWMVGQGGCGIVTSPAAGSIVAAVLTGEPLPREVTDLGISAESLAPRRG